MQAEKRERKRERLRECSIGSTQEENLSRPWTGEQEELSVGDILQSVCSSYSEVLEVCDFPQNIALAQQRRRVLAGECTDWCKDLLGHTGRECNPSWSTFERGYIASPWTKTLQAPANGLLLAGDRGMSRGCCFIGCYTIDSTYCVSTGLFFSGTKDTSCTVGRLYSQGRSRSTWCRVL